MRRHYLDSITYTGPLLPLCCATCLTPVFQQQLKQRPTDATAMSRTVLLFLYCRSLRSLKCLFPQLLNISKSFLHCSLSLPFSSSLTSSSFCVQTLTSYPYYPTRLF